MALNAFEIVALQNNMFYGVGNTSRGGGAFASEFPLVADNINGQLARYTRLAGVWQSANITSTTTVSNSTAQNNGNINAGSAAQPWRPFSAYFVRGTSFTTPADGSSNLRSGYIGSFVGGFGGGAVTSGDEENAYGHDPNGATVDFEPIYGHNSSDGFPQTADFNHMFRDQVHLPVDGNAVVTKSATAQTWTRTPYMPPVHYVLWNDNTPNANQTLGSGNVGFYVEERPSLQVAGVGSHCPFTSEGVVTITGQTIGNTGSILAPQQPSQQSIPVSADLISTPYEYFNVSGQRELNSRSMSLLWARIFDNGPNAFGWRFEEDGTDIVGGVFAVNAAQTLAEYPWQRSGGLVTSPPASTAQEQRVRNAAYFTINEEYYGFVMDTKCMIFSNKSSMFPMLFFDLVDTWGDISPRVAGVAVTGTSGSNKIYFLSEDGALAVYDFTAANGSLSLLTAAEAPLANEGYSSLAVSSDGLTLYALYGTWVQDHRLTSIGVSSPRVGVLSYTIGSDTWTPISGADFSPLGGRINGRHLREMMALRDGRMAIVCEDVAVNSGNTYNTLVAAGDFTLSPPVAENNCAWQVMFFDPSATAKWNTSIINGGTPLVAPVTGTITNLQLTGGTLTVTVANTFSVTNYVTFGGIINSSWIWLNGLTVKVATQAAGNFTAAIVTAIHNTVGSTAVTAGTATRGMQYGTDITSYWYRNINAHMHDVAANTLLVQSNWTCGGLWSLALNAAGGAGPTTATLTNVSQGTPTNIAHANIAPQTTTGTGKFAGSNPVDIRHTQDYAAIGDRTFFWFNDRFPSAIDTSSGTSTMRMYLAPPSFVWDGTQQLSALDRDSVNATGYLSSWGTPLAAGGSTDTWTVGDLTPHDPINQTNSGAWTFITQVRDNYCHFVKIASGNAPDGVTSAIGTVYGKRVTQTLAYLPTYWKWTGAVWALADSSSDAKSNPRPVSSTPGVDVSMPYGLILNFGTSVSSSYGASEFYTFCLCYGNTKFLRNARYPWALFAGQTFLQTDTRNMSDERALAAHLVDTDLMTVTTDNSSISDGQSPPTSPTVTLGTSLASGTSGVGRATLATWPKLNPSNQPFNGPLQMVLAASGSPNPATAVVPPVNPGNLVAGGSITSRSWLVGANTYVATASSTNASYDVQDAFFGSPNVYWKATAQIASLTIDLGAANAQTVRAYSFRPFFDSNSTTNSCPRTWTIQGSNTGAFTGEQTTVDTQTLVTPKRGMAFNVVSPGSFRYYRMSITVTGNGSISALGMLQFYTAVLGTTCSFSDLVFLNYGDNAVEGNYFRNNQFARGLTFEVSTDGGSNYTPITPLWRAHNGFAFCFNRQTGITNVRITCQSGYNYGTSAGGNTNNVVNNAFGPVYLVDWMTGAGQGALNTARVGDSGASDATPARGSWDTECLGIAVDAATLSIDSGSPNQLTPQLIATTYDLPVPSGSDPVEAATALQIWDFNPVDSLAYKIHPFWGFVLFDGAGQQGGLSTKFSHTPSVLTGTSLAIAYHWGRRI